MTPILDTIVAVRAARLSFVPQTASDLFALRLADHLHEPTAAFHYASLLESFPESQLLAAFFRAKDMPLAAHFHALLKEPLPSQNSAPSKLLALKVERRSLSAACFVGDQLEYAQRRELPAERNKAESSVLSFLSWLVETFSPTGAALELQSGYAESARAALDGRIEQALKERLLSIWRIGRKMLLQSCAFPALKSRGQLRQVVFGIWPALTQASLQDAAALGLFVQVERRFNS